MGSMSPTEDDETATKDFLERVAERRAEVKATPSHETHGHPPLLAPGTEFWMKWEEWNEGQRKKSQEDHVKRIDILIKPSLEHYYKLHAEKRGGLELPTVTFPEAPPETASYDEKQSFLLKSTDVALEIALSRRLESPVERRPSMQTSLDKYRLLYQRLKLRDPSKTIRLLELLPGEFDNPIIETRLFNADLGALGSGYDALSYAWGSVSDDQNTYSIRVNGMKQTVTPNLYSALLSLRLPDASRTIWVDSVCINQGDHKERAQQVTLMAKIYAQAERVVVYLGPSNPVSNTFFRFMHLDVCQPEMCDSCGYNHSEYYWRQLPRDACDEAGLEESDVLDGFIDVCSRRWWNRVWILQEYTLSKQDPIIHCGRDSISNRIFTEIFSKVYDWVSHRKLHPEQVSGCNNPACYQEQPTEEDGCEMSSRKAAMVDVEEETQVERDEATNWKGIFIQTQNLPGRQWSSWGYQVWKANSVMKRRTGCRQWHPPSYIYQHLKAQCTDPHDIVYGVRELMEPLCKDIFKPDYVLPIPKLYTKLAAYMLIFDVWTEMFWYYPHRLSESELGTKAAGNIPSWVPDFSRPLEVMEAEKRPNEKKATVIFPWTTPHILDRILFMEGWMLDEIVDVYPLPTNDAFKVLQQLWYVERHHGKPAYRSFGEDSTDGSEEQDAWEAMVDRHAGIPGFPSILWATRYEDPFPLDTSFIQVLCKVANFEKMPDVMKRCGSKVLSIVKEQLGIKPGQRKTPEDKERVLERCNALLARLFAVWNVFVVRRWVDFVGICTFDYENLRAQIRHGLISTIPWKPARIGKRRTFNEEEEDLADAPLITAVLQKPIQYNKVLDTIYHDCEDEAELELRKETILELAEVVHEATMSLIGGEGEVVHINLDERNHTEALYDPPADFSSDSYEYSDNEDDCSSDGEDSVVFDDFQMVPLPRKTDRIEDGPVIGFWIPGDVVLEEENLEGIRIEGYLKPKKAAPAAEGDDRVYSATEGDIYSDQDAPCLRGGSGGEEGAVEAAASLLEHNESDGEDSESEVESVADDTSQADLSGSQCNEEPDEASEASAATSNFSPAEPHGEWTRWRRQRTKRRDVNFLFQDIVDFLSGREFFVTETGLLGLTGPHTRGVRDGDDLFLLSDMSFPLIARLEPSPALGNPKKRRRQMPTIRMRREILGTAILKDFDMKGGELEEVEFPPGFEPLSGLNHRGYFRFK